MHASIGMSDLEGRGASVLLADGIAVVGPHHLQGGAAGWWQWVLRGDHAQLDKLTL